MCVGSQGLPSEFPGTLSVAGVGAKGMIEAIVDETTARLARRTVVKQLSHWLSPVVTCGALADAGRG